MVAGLTWRDRRILCLQFALQNDQKLIEQYDMTVHSRNHIRELIVLTKFWKVRTIDALKKSNTHDEAKRFSWVKSIHLELACLTAMKEMSEHQGFQMAFGRVLTLLARDLDNSALAAQLEMSQSYLGLQKAARSVSKTEARKSLRKMGEKQSSSMFCRPTFSNQQSWRAWKFHHGAKGSSSGSQGDSQEGHLYDSNRWSWSWRWQALFSRQSTP